MRAARLLRVGLQTAVLFGLVPAWFSSARAEGRLFGVVGKSADDANFQAVVDACNRVALAHGDRCISLSAEGPAQARNQGLAITRALERQLSALAVSVISSRWLALGPLGRAQLATLPIVTFDSDLRAEHEGLRRAYVGPDNEAVGRRLGEAARADRPRGGTVCLLSGNTQDTNLNQRMLGVRRALSQSSSFPDGARLEGQGGWREPARCPFFNDDDDVRSLRQLRVAAQVLEADAIIAVGHWPVVERAHSEPVLRELSASRKPPLVYVGVGELPENGAELLAKGWVRAFVSIDFREMGERVYETLRACVDGEPVPSVASTSVKVVR